MAGRQKAINVVAPACNPGVPRNKSMQSPVPKPANKSCQHDENQIDIRMNITAQTDIVDDQHLQQYEYDETDNLYNGLVHVIGILLSTNLARVYASL